MQDGRAKPRHGAAEDSRTPSESSFSIAEDSGTALLLAQTGGEASGIGIQQLLRQNSEFQRMQREVDADGASSAASPNAASPVQPLEGLFSTRSLRAGDDSSAALKGTIAKLAAQQLASPKRSAASHGTTSVRASSSNIRASSGLDSDMLNSTYASDVDPRALDTTAVGHLRNESNYDDEFDVEDDDEVEAEAEATSEDASDAEEAAVELQVRKAKHDIELRRHRDEVEEEEYECRREVEDNQRTEGWIGDGWLAAAFERFHQQTEVMEDEEEGRHALNEQENSLSCALRDVMEQEQGTLHRNRIVANEHTARLAAEHDASSTLSEHMALFRSIALQIKLDANEAAARASIADDASTALGQLSDDLAVGHRNAHWRQDAREAASAILFDSEDSSRDVILSHQLDEHLTLDDCTSEFFAVVGQEANAFAELQREGRRGRLEAQCKAAVRGIQAQMVELESLEHAARKAATSQEWEERRPMYEAHRSKFLQFRPRKPPVPRAPRRAFIPRAPPTKPEAVVPAAPTQRSAGDNPVYIRPKIRKVKPLPLKKLPPFADAAAAAVEHKTHGRLCATLVDESVGRKSLATREQQQWITLLGVVRSTCNDAATTAAMMTTTTPADDAAVHRNPSFRVSHLDHGRYYEFREQAKLRRVQNEERSKLQTLVTRLIAVDMAFEAKAARVMGKHRVTSVREVRPPFNCGSNTDAWEPIRRLGVGDSKESSPARSPTATSSAKHTQQQPTVGAAQLRPATATHAARPPAAPRPVQSARPVARESFQQALDRSLDEALGLRSPTNRTAEDASQSAQDEPRVLDLAPSSSSSSTRSSTSTSRSTTPNASRHDDSYCSDHAATTSTANLQQQRSEPLSTTLVHHDSEYADESFYSSVASPHRHEEDVQCSAQGDADAAPVVASPPPERSAPERMRVSPLKEEPVHSLIRDPVAKSSSPPPRSSDVQLCQRDEGRTSRSSSASSSCSRSGKISSNTSEDSWHPMATA